MSVENEEAIDVAAEEHNDLDRELLRYRVHLDRALKMMPMISANGIRRVLIAFLKSGMEEPELTKKEEKVFYKELMQLHDVKYMLIQKAIDGALKEEENTNG